MSSGQVRDELVPLINEPIPLAVGIQPRQEPRQLLQLQLLSPIFVILLTVRARQAACASHLLVETYVAQLLHVVCVPGAAVWTGQRAQERERVHLESGAVVRR